MKSNTLLFSSLKANSEVSVDCSNLMTCRRKKKKKKRILRILEKLQQIQKWL